MNKLQKIGSYILGGVLVLALFSRQKISFGVKGVYLNGIITNQTIPLRIVGWLSNSTVASVLVRGISGVLICNGQTVATISQTINKRIKPKTFVQQSFMVNIFNQESLSALFANIQSGDINNLAFELIGEIVVGEQWPVSLKFNKVFTWKEIQQVL